MNINNCIRNLLKFICVLQNNSLSASAFDNDCSKPFLGPNLSYACYNTRVISLYNKFGNNLTANFIIDNVEYESSYFRVCEVNDNCCKLLILNKIDDSFISTKQFITVNISCICAIKCIEDAVVSNL